MAKNFWCYASNGEYGIGTRGRIIYVYDCNGNEIAQFKDMNYVYELVISPNGNILVARSNEGIIAVYDLKNLSLIKKFRYGKDKDPHDENLCFSPDGKLIYVIVYTFNTKKEKPEYCINVYETQAFTLVKRIFEGEGIGLFHIENNPFDNTYFILGANKRHFIAKLKDDKLEDIFYISEVESTRYTWLKEWEICGFTEKSRQQFFEDEMSSKEKYVLSRLWKMCHDNQKTSE